MTPQGACVETAGMIGLNRIEFRRLWWRVAALRRNHSAFNGYHPTPSDYSAIRCTSCGAYWRTKAAYVDDLIVEADR